MMISFDGFATVAMPMIVSVFSAVWSMLAPVLLAEQILFVDQTKLYIQSPIFLSCFVWSVEIESNPLVWC